jgi:PilZ domain-containing protein
MAISDRRKHRRFDFPCRARLEFRSAGSDSHVDGITKNVSVGGLLMESPSRIPEHSAVTFTIAAEGGLLTYPIEFVGEGKVVRVEPAALGDGYAIALECVRPIKFHPFDSRNDGRHLNR